MLDAIRLELLGTPTLTIIQDRFEKAANLHCKTRGWPDLPLVIEPVFDGGHPEAVGEFAEQVIAEVARSLTTPVEPAD